MNKTLNITKVLQSKIDYLITSIANCEWSGILFYNYHSDNIINGLDVFPMNIGSSCYTEFEINQDVIAYMVDNDLVGCKLGLIHSHHSMPTFFSNTDTETLDEKGKECEFLSLIVNNVGIYNAKLNIKGIIEPVTVHKYVSEELQTSFLCHIDTLKELKHEQDLEMQKQVVMDKTSLFGDIQCTLSSPIDTTFKVDSTDVAKPLTREEKFKIVSTFIWFSVTGVIPKNDKKYFPVYNKKLLQNLNIDLDALYLMAFALLDYMIIDTTEEDSEEIIERIVDTLHEYYALPMESSYYFIKIKNALINYL